MNFAKVTLEVTLEVKREALRRLEVALLQLRADAAAGLAPVVATAASAIAIRIEHRK